MYFFDFDRMSTFNILFIFVCKVYLETLKSASFNNGA